MKAYGNRVQNTYSYFAFVVSPHHPTPIRSFVSVGTSIFSLVPRLFAIHGKLLYLRFTPFSLLQKIRQLYFQAVGPLEPKDAVLKTVK